MFGVENMNSREIRAFPFS